MADRDAEEVPSELELPDDALVAAVAAVSTIALTLALEYGLGSDPPILARLAPLAPYFLSVFTRRIDLGPFDTVRVWTGVTVAVTLGVFLFYAV
ncbi:hypothetical protein [Halopelagius longus]|uniref:DUF8049 domain-containing protein n=1 Tax=Halopelagius longus TaxID=1236180 RepID=A0A1H1AEK9_9EURY|nr:hypothetical protein [Halopelagius longus]RDI70352.1 hypothetical protein DWB78_00675 [Halopelagius longus]SDQ38145.1 hypothetical protein SAMN05216278_1301 [Halopelagius longus]